MIKAEREYRKALAKHKAASAARFALPAGSSRARVTSANAKLQRHAEWCEYLAGYLRNLGVDPEPIRAEAMK